jgi:hypothetical protein
MVGIIESDGNYKSMSGVVGPVLGPGGRVSKCNLMSIRELTAFLETQLDLRYAMRGIYYDHPQQITCRFRILPSNPTLASFFLIPRVMQCYCLILLTKIGY